MNIGNVNPDRRRINSRKLRSWMKSKKESAVLLSLMMKKINVKMFFFGYFDEIIHN